MNDIQVLGLDIGNSFTKTSEGIKIKSKVSSNYDSSFKRNVVQVIRNGKKYLVGDESGSGFRSVDKFDNENYITCLLTAIALSFPEITDIKVKVVLGTPIQHYDDFKEKCIESTMNIGEQLIELEGEEITINILDVLVYPQSAILGDKSVSDNFPAVVFDVGGLTTDISIWSVANESGETKFIKDAGMSYDIGFDKVVESYSNELSNRYNIRMTETESIESLSEDEYVGLRGEVDLKPIRDKIVGEYIKMIYGKVSDDLLPIGKCKVMHVIGGSAKVLIPYLMDEEYGFGIPEDRLIVGEHPQFTNARIFGALGKVHFTDSDRLNSREVTE